MFSSWRQRTDASAIENALTLLTLWLISATGEVLLWIWQQHGSPPLLFTIATHLLAAVSFSSVLLFAVGDVIDRLDDVLSKLRRLRRTLAGRTDSPS